MQLFYWGGKYRRPLRPFRFARMSDELGPVSGSQPLYFTRRAAAVLVPTCTPMSQSRLKAV